MTSADSKPTYSNPILNADWPDPDAIEVDGCYYLISSSFNRAPGLPVLRSRNLVDWEHLGHALKALPPVDHFSLVRHGSGVWAPALRHHDGRFWIFYPDPDHGIFVLHSEKAEGPWSEPHLLYPGRGIIDPCPLWDEDGKAYLVHGWAKSRIGLKNVLTVHRMSPDASRLLDSGTHVIKGEDFPGYTTIEGPKFYKRDGWYWIFAPAGGVATGWQSVFRARSPFGPYEARKVLEQGNSAVNGPHQGAWVTTPAGQDWFLHFQDRGPYGRVVHLQPMGWGDDGWPWMGAQFTDAPAGTPVLTHPYPRGTSPDSVHLPTSDDFREGSLGNQWHWQANPQADWLSLPGDGRAILHCQPNDPGNLRELPNVLGQILPGVPSVFSTSIELGDVPAGTRAGVVVLGLEYAWLGLRRTPTGVQLSAGTGGSTPQEEQLGAPVDLQAGAIQFRVRTDARHRAHFAWRPRGAGEWHEQDWEFTLAKGHWIGAELGIFATSPRGSSGTGDVIVGTVQLEAARTAQEQSPEFAGSTPL